MRLCATIEHMKDNVVHLVARVGPERARTLLRSALSFAQARMGFTPFELQNALRTGYEEALILYDWLTDEGLARSVVSEHMIRCGRRYVLNTPWPTLEGLAIMLDTGQSRAFAIMLELEKRGIIKIGADFSLHRVGRMSSFEDLVRQLRWVAKKYRGRCEPQLLQRILYLDPFTAIRLAQYGEEHLGLRWKERPRELL